MKRREAREVILQLLFQRDFMGEVDESDLPEEPYVLEVFNGVAEHQSQIDQIISDRSEDWKLDRLYSVDRNLLRMGIYELLYRDDVPPEVVINEAVELAKSYGTEKSPSFINGVLDRVLKESVQR